MTCSPAATHAQARSVLLLAYPCHDGTLTPPWDRCPGSAWGHTAPVLSALSSPSQTVTQDHCRHQASSLTAQGWPLAPGPCFLVLRKVSQAAAQLPPETKRGVPRAPSSAPTTALQTLGSPLSPLASCWWGAPLKAPPSALTLQKGCLTPAEFLRLGDRGNSVDSWTQDPGPRGPGRLTPRTGAARALPPTVL